MPTKEELQYESDIRAVQAYLGAESSTGRISRDEAETRILDDPGLITLANESMKTKATVKAPASTILQLNQASSWTAALRSLHTNYNLYGLLAVDSPIQDKAYGVGGFLWHDYGYATQAGVVGKTNAANSVGVIAYNTSNQNTQGVALHARATHLSTLDNDPKNHAVILENTASNWPSILALYMSGEIQSETTSFDNFITFLARNDANNGDVALGAIEGNSSGGGSAEHFWCRYRRVS